MGMTHSSSGGGSPVNGLGATVGSGGDGDPVRLVIPSDTSAVRGVQDRIMSEVVRCGFDGQSQFAIKLALEEGLINAIKHGNRLDPGKRVHVEYTCSTRELVVCIEDEGPGFERAEVPDPTMDENIEKCSGRGILLIESYMTSVGWTRGGRRIRMVKRNGAGS
jgi:serine/threonine-protein kinase RsbW